MFQYTWAPAGTRPVMPLRTAAGWLYWPTGTWVTVSKARSWAAWASFF